MIFGLPRNSVIFCRSLERELAVRYFQAHKKLEIMNPSYFRIRLSQQDAMSRLSDWLNLSVLVQPVEVDSYRAVELAFDEKGRWRGCALFVYENQGWTIFEDLTGRFSGTDSKDWLTFAEQNDFVFAGYNDAIGYGEIVVLEACIVVREFFEDMHSADEKKDIGSLPDESAKPIKSWIDVASFVDQDDIAYGEKGWLCLLR